MGAYFWLTLHANPMQQPAWPWTQAHRGVTLAVHGHRCIRSLLSPQAILPVRVRTMSTDNTELRRQIQLRTRAVSQLGNEDGQSETRLSSSAAMRVLHALASSPATAGDAIALLHELQVHQVELDLQHEEMQSGSLELERTLYRQTQLYDHSPVALFSVDPTTALHELNLAAARLLGKERVLLLGQSLDSHLSTSGRLALRTLMDGAKAVPGGLSGRVELERKDFVPRTLLASVSTDPAGSGFLIAISG